VKKADFTEGDNSKKAGCWIGAVDYFYKITRIKIIILCNKMFNILEYCE